MLKRIACGVVVSSLLMLWPVVSAAGDEEETKRMALMEEYFVFPDKGEEFEEQIKIAREAAVAHGFPYRFDSYKTDDMRYLAVWWIDGSAGLDKLWAAWAKVGEEWGEEEFANWTKNVHATMSHYESSLWIPRNDLSYLPDNEDELKYFVWGLLPIKAGHLQVVEELVKETLKTYAKHEVPYAWSAAEGFIGVDYPTLAFFEWSASPGSYWMRNDEIHSNEEFMKEAGAVWEKIAPHVRGYERVTGYYLKELSYRPKKKAEGAGEN